MPPMLAGPSARTMLQLELGVLRGLHWDAVIRMDEPNGGERRVVLLSAKEMTSLWVRMAFWRNHGRLEDIL